MLALAKVELDAAQPEYLAAELRRQLQLIHVESGRHGYFNKPSPDLLGHRAFRKHTTLASKQTREEKERDLALAELREGKKPKELDMPAWQHKPWTVPRLTHLISLRRVFTRATMQVSPLLGAGSTSACPASAAALQCRRRLAPKSQGQIAREAAEGGPPLLRGDLCLRQSFARCTAERKHPGRLSGAEPACRRLRLSHRQVGVAQAVADLLWPQAKPLASVPKK